MKKEQYDALPDTEKHHYNYCEKCKEYFDLRDHKEVRKHVHGISSEDTAEISIETATV